MPTKRESSAEAEDGLLGLTIDPAFSTNGLVYLYYSPVGSETGERACQV